MTFPLPRSMPETMATFWSPGYSCASHLVSWPWAKLKKLDASCFSKLPFLREPPPVCYPVFPFCLKSSKIVLSTLLVDIRSAFYTTQLSVDSIRIPLQALAEASKVTAHMQKSHYLPYELQPIISYWCQ